MQSYRNNNTDFTLQTHCDFSVLSTNKMKLSHIINTLKPNLNNSTIPYIERFIGVPYNTLNMF